MKETNYSIMDVPNSRWSLTKVVPFMSNQTPECAVCSCLLTIMENLTAICKLCSSFGPHHNTCSTKTSGTKGEGLYIVIITEEGTNVPRRCETVAATDTEAPRASALRVLAALCLDPHGLS